MQHAQFHLGVLVASDSGEFLRLGQAALHGLKVFELQLRVDDFLVANGVHRAVDVHHVAVVEAAQHVDDSVCLAYVAQELVAQPLAFRRALDEAGYVYNLDRGGHDAPRMDDFGQSRQPLVGYGDDAHVGFDGAEREVGRLRLGARQAVEKRGLAHVGQPHYAAL